MTWPASLLLCVSILLLGVAWHLWWEVKLWQVRHRHAEERATFHREWSARWKSVAFYRHGVAPIDDDHKHAN